MIFIGCIRNRKRGIFCSNGEREIFSGNIGNRGLTCWIYISNNKMIDTTVYKNIDELIPEGISARITMRLKNDRYFMMCSVFCYQERMIYFLWVMAVIIK